jgi:hypothetical protein
MKLSHSFPQHVHDYHFWTHKCYLCSKQAQQKHHVLGRVSGSILNCAPLCAKCHIGNSELDSFDMQQFLLKKVKRILDSDYYKYSQDDLDFIEKYKKYYE